MMVAKIRISSIVIRPFYREGDVVAWIRKTKLVARLQSIIGVVRLMAQYPERSTLVLYLEMDKQDQLSMTKIKQCLREAYMEKMYATFTKLEMV